MRSFLAICLMMTCVSLTAHESERTNFSIFAAFTEMGGDLKDYSQPVTVGTQYRLKFTPKFNLNFEAEARFGSKLHSYFDMELDQYGINCIPEFKLNNRFSIMLGGGLGYISNQYTSSTVASGLAGVSFTLNSRFKLFVRQDYIVELSTSEGRTGFTNESLTAGLTKAGLYFNF